MIIHCDSVRYIWEVMENKEYGFLFDDLIVLDAGCNIGTFSLWIYPHTSIIHAVDMEQKYLDLFNETIKANSLTKIKLYKDRVTDMASFMFGHGINMVDILKMDIEGDEIEVFNQSNFPKDRIRTIIGEYHNRPVKDKLQNLGYRYFDYPNQHFMART